MPRVRGNVQTRARRKKILKLAKGYFGSKHTLYKTAHETVMKALAYGYRDRKQTKRNMRKLWITRINAACRLNGFKYSSLICLFKFRTILLTISSTKSGVPFFSKNILYFLIIII